jgi:hypothetical protein
MQKINDIAFSSLELLPQSADLWKLNSDLSVYVNFADGSQWEFEIGKGFVTDLRSGSHLIDFFVPKSACMAYSAAVVIHDANYTADRDGGHSLTRKESDELLKAMIDWANEHRYEVEGMDGKSIESLKVPAWKTSVMKWALSLFGSSHWETKKTRNSDFVMPMLRQKWMR